MDAKVTGFKSGLLAQFTGNALQKDDKAFVRYNSTSGQYEDYTSVDNLHLDPSAVYRPEYESTHVRCIKRFNCSGSFCICNRT